jgi:bisphosphoglycerate-independent phosphoglycerate mutase (AlkP superfamily)
MPDAADHGNAEKMLEEDGLSHTRTRRTRATICTAAAQYGKAGSPTSSALALLGPCDLYE